MTLLDVTLKLTRGERAYVFMKGVDGNLRLAAGRNAKGEPLLDDKTISHSILDDALKSNSEFVLTDTSRSLDLSGRQSIVAYDLRTVICVPLRKPQVQTTRETLESPSMSAEVMGALYVDSRFASRDISTVSNNILHAIATEAASMIENARLVQAEETSRALSTGALDCRIHPAALDGRHHPPKFRSPAWVAEIFLVKKSAVIFWMR